MTPIDDDSTDDVIIELTGEDAANFLALLTHPSDDFLELVRISGLDPATDFVGANLRDSVIDGDVGEFDFSYADLRGADFSGARNKTREMFTGAVTDADTRGVPGTEN
jgi:uncharacterized protein YjbI with pentapeptide repeats